MTSWTAAFENNLLYPMPLWVRKPHQHVSKHHI